MQQTILITGIEGFTGQYAEHVFLERGYRVVGLTNGDENRDTWKKCDLRDKKSVSALVQETEPSGVLHLAGIASPTHDNANEFYDSNTIGTTNLLEALATIGDKVKKVILASSSNVYGSQAGQLDESMPFLPKSHYATSKIAMELMTTNFFDRLPIIIARPFNYTGRGQTTKFVVPKIVEHFKRRAASIQLGNIEVERDFLDVRDVTHAYAALFESELEGTAVNICSGRAISLTYVIETLSTLANHQLKVEINPEFVRPNDIPVITGNPTKLNQSASFKPRYQFEDTLKWMLDD